MSEADSVCRGRKRRADFDEDDSGPPAKTRKISYDGRRIKPLRQPEAQPPRQPLKPEKVLKYGNDHVNPSSDCDIGQPFRLLDLPTEVRLEIYRACVTRPFNIVLSKTPPPPIWDENDYVDMYNRPRRRSPRLRACNTETTSRRAGSFSSSPQDDVSSTTTRPRRPKPQDADPLLVNLLATCQLVYREARSVLYGENRFDIELTTARYTLGGLHQRSRGIIHALRLSIPPGNDALERFAEIVRLSLRYCWHLQTLTIKMASAFESGSHANIYAHAFDNLRWLPKDCKVVLEGRVDPEVEKVVQLKAALAKSLDEAAYARRQLMASDKSFPMFAVEGFGRRPLLSDVGQSARSPTE